MTVTLTSSATEGDRPVNGGTVPGTGEECVGLVDFDNDRDTRSTVSFCVSPVP